MARTSKKADIDLDVVRRTLYDIVIDGNNTENVRVQAARVLLTENQKGEGESETIVGSLVDAIKASTKKK